MELIPLKLLVIYYAAFSYAVAHKPATASLALVAALHQRYHD
ncbi:MAG TPA: hypothetical protein VGB77_21580 [Abditibacteriaceae bacterium]|jgi:hypothetical protein